MKSVVVSQYFLEWLSKLRNTIIFLLLMYLIVCTVGILTSKTFFFYVIVKNYFFLRSIFITVQSIFDIQKINDFFKYILPITLTVYTFSYREKKQIAPSSINGIYEKIKLNLFLGLAVPTYMYGVFIHNLLDKWETPYYLINIWEITVLLSFVLLCTIISQSFDNINVTKLLHLTNKQIKGEIIDLRNIINNSDKPSDRVYELIIKKENRIHAHIESIYQMLGYMNKNNMNHKFIEMLEEIKEPITIFNDAQFLKSKGNNYIDIKKIEIFERVYNTLCTNHIKLIETLFNENKISKAKLALEIFVRHLKPNLKNKALDARFNTVLNELILNYKMDDMQNLKILLRALSEMDRGKIEKIYEQLMLITVENQDVKVLCNIVYPITRRVEVFKRSSKKDPSSLMFKAIQLSIIQKDIHLIMKSILKSIELGHHSCTGFLIKFLVTRYEGKHIKKAVESFTSVSANLELDFTEDEQETVEQNSEQKVGFDFNPDTFEYCYYKMVILIYGQQKYAMLKQLQADKKNSVDYIDIVKLISKCNHIEYVLEKIKNRKSDYGLIYIQSDKFMYSLKRDLKRKSESPS